MRPASHQKRVWRGGQARPRRGSMMGNQKQVDLSDGSLGRGWMGEGFPVRSILSRSTDIYRATMTTTPPCRLLVGSGHALARTRARRPESQLTLRLTSPWKTSSKPERAKPMEGQQRAHAAHSPSRVQPLRRPAAPFYTRRRRCVAGQAIQAEPHCPNKKQAKGHPVPLGV
ncbi:uncharacterized protein LY79DRAFT_38676 [Colletotrichum navitas]|uniref:Uncharacterized protein n=1 Tax=Colletotrichum navitas TaxID=681940 RepID=A0AAD8PNQ4_9PEZI|nr:uncharacterized protein LY79DRAFT_38676 [Colletotrichum navitas]KAK1572963.1 hypothetical protein LY79DRAFT_38676 [Colletotrichum navitas]